MSKKDTKHPIFTIGHSTRSIEEFIGLLLAHGVTKLIDIRTVPKSRTNPQFNIDVLPETLAMAGIKHRHMPGLGGLRKPNKNSINAAWQNSSFRGYADYMQTEAFAVNLAELIAETKGETVAIMCAESLPWRCHRSLVADALVGRGISVSNIMTKTNAQPHKLRPFAQVSEQTIIYPAAEAS